MWPKIRAALPEATLHVYYGWNTYYQIEKNNPERMIWMKRMQKMMEQPGVINHGRLGQKELAEDLLKTSFWLYPTYFPEISCITAMEMQAAGVIPMTSGYAALEETQGRVGLKLPGDVYDPEWQEKYLTRVISHAKYGPELKEHFQKSRDFLIEELRKQSKEFNWDNVAVKWNKELI
jgi:glycosyltransferase involved in cell wall biosynthesis